MDGNQRSHHDRQAAGSARRCSSRREPEAGPCATGRAQRRLAAKQQPGVSAAGRSKEQRCERGQSVAAPPSRCDAVALSAGRVARIASRVGTRLWPLRRRAFFPRRGSAFAAPTALGRGSLHVARGKSHLIIMFTVGPDDVAEGDRTAHRTNSRSAAGRYADAPAEARPHCRRAITLEPQATAIIAPAAANAEQESA
jgi:hypothetical protein